MISGSSTLFSRLHALLWSGVVSRVATGRRVAYLTFDDGPSGGLPDLLDLLDRTSSKATFFFRGDRLEHRVDFARATLDAGHTVGCHGYAHLSAWHNGQQKLEADLMHSLRVFTDHLGIHPVMVRPPYGRLRPSNLRSYRAAGLRPVLWDVDPVDYREPRNPLTICRAMEKRIRPGSIVLLHDGAGAWEDGWTELEHWIRSRQYAGWMFESLTTEVV